MDPDLTASFFIIVLSKVDLPIPLGPIIATRSPLLTWKEISLTIVLSG